MPPPSKPAPPAPMFTQIIEPDTQPVSSNPTSVPNNNKQTH